MTQPGIRQGRDPPPVPLPGLLLPVVQEGEVRERLQDAPAGAPPDTGDGCGERAQDLDGGAQPGEHRVAAQHPDAAGPQHCGQLHRGHPQAQEEGKRLCGSLGGAGRAEVFSVWPGGGRCLFCVGTLVEGQESSLPDPGATKGSSAQLCSHPPPGGSAACSIQDSSGVVRLWCPPYGVCNSVSEASFPGGEIF